MTDHGATNEEYPAYFTRSVQSARMSHRTLIASLRELHLRHALQRDCTGQHLGTLANIDVERHSPARIGVTVDFISEVARHVPSTLSVSELVTTILNPISKVSLNWSFPETSEDTMARIVKYCWTLTLCPLILPHISRIALRLPLYPACSTPATRVSRTSSSASTRRRPSMMWPGRSRHTKAAAPPPPPSAHPGQRRIGWSALHATLTNHFWGRRRSVIGWTHFMVGNMVLSTGKLFCLQIVDSWVPHNDNTTSSPHAQVRVRSAWLASTTVRGAVLLLNSEGSALSLAWPAADISWTLRAKGGQV